MTNLLEQAEIQKTLTDNILNESGILPILQKYGKVKFHGSYFLNLMNQDSDLDIFVINPNVNNQTAEKALNEILATKFWTDSRIYDFAENRKDGFPPGQYVWLSAQLENKLWDLSIMFIKEYPPEQLKQNEWLLANLTDKKRQLILEIKELRDRNHLPIESINICVAVVNEDVKSVEEAIQYFKITAE